MNPRWDAYCQKESPVRYRDEFELKCPTCLHWWPITLEFWRPHHGMRRCKACWNEYHAARMREYHADPEQRAVDRFKSRARYQSLDLEKTRAAKRRWRERNRDHVREYNRAYHARTRATA